jgi:hypothetical protein
LAPTVPGTYTITAITTSAPFLTGTAMVIVKSADQDGDGKTLLDFGDLAVVADNYALNAPAGQDDGPSDLNGDGTVDDRDGQLALDAFAGQGSGRPLLPARKRR